MKFDKELLIEMAYGDGFIEDKIVDTTRWSALHRAVFASDGKFYVTNYVTGLTEQQDESPYEYDDDMVECPEVGPKEVVVTVYEKV